MLYLNAAFLYWCHKKSMGFTKLFLTLQKIDSLQNFTNVSITLVQNRLIIKALNCQENLESNTSIVRLNTTSFFC